MNKRKSQTLFRKKKKKKEEEEDGACGMNM